MRRLGAAQLPEQPIGGTDLAQLDERPGRPGCGGRPDLAGSPALDRGDAVGGRIPRPAPRSVLLTAPRRTRLGKTVTAQAAEESSSSPPSSLTSPRGVSKRPRISAAGTPGRDRVAEQIAGDVLAVVLAVAPVQRDCPELWSSWRPLGRTAPVAERLATVRAPPRRPSPPRPQPQFGPAPAIRRGRSARRRSRSRLARKPTTRAASARSPAASSAIAPAAASRGQT